MELADFSKILKSHFSINWEPTDEGYKIRFVGPPYIETDAACRALSVIAHDRGKGSQLRLSPLVIRRVLSKFEIPEDRFQEAYSLSTKRVTPISPTPPKQAPPTKPTSPKEEAS
jgi:hypothetical protein